MVIFLNYSNDCYKYTDEDLSNNVADLVQIVVGSFDNDKTCLEGETVTKYGR
ncbi:hypothetical protein [Flavobacterium sp.]|uniref:hypothetical protein n=1 Tax=Flavobacterium sp. TaxID=239 RepID=UPI003529C02E